MKRETLFNALGQVRESYVNEAAAPPRPKTHWYTWGALAACAVLAAAAIFALPTLRGRPGSSVPTIDTELPRLPVADFSGAFGFEGYIAYSPDELVDAGPWREEEALETLPVFCNVNPADTAGLATGDPEALEAQVRDYAARLGVDAQNLTITRQNADALMEGGTGICAVVGEGEGVRITVHASQQVQIMFTPARALPEGLHFTYRDSTYEDMEAVGRYLLAEYTGLFAGMEHPVACVAGGDRTFAGEQGYELLVYDDGGDTASRLLSHDLARIRFCCDDDGALWILWINAFDLSQKAGDYPIVSPAEARALLCNGNYITTVPAAMPGEDRIVRVELLYRADLNAAYFMPYYRFLVYLTDEELGFNSSGLGLNQYGAYYVPAVRGEYLTEMPVWDGSFN